LEEREFNASDYFGQLYEFALKLIRKGRTYLDDLSADEIRQYRGTLTEPGKESPYRNFLNPASLETLTGCYVEPSLGKAQPGARFQFERQGYFCVDKDSQAQRASWYSTGR